MRINIANMPFILPMSKNPGTDYTHPESDKSPRTRGAGPELAEPCHTEESHVPFAEAGQGCRRSKQWGQNAKQGSGQ